MATWQDLQLVPKQNPWQSLQSTTKNNPWASLYPQQNLNIGTNQATLENNSSPLMERLSRGLFGTAKKLFGPVTSFLSPLEVGVDALIRKDEEKNFRQRFLEAGKSGSDIGGALMTRGMNPKLAMPLGFAASLAIPGAGELSQIKKADKLVDLVKNWKLASNIDELANAEKAIMNVASDLLPKSTIKALKNDPTKILNEIGQTYDIKGLDEMMKISGQPLFSKGGMEANEKLLNKVSKSQPSIPEVKINNFINEVGSRPYVSGIPQRWMYKKNGVPTDVPQEISELLDKTNFKTIPSTKVTKTSNNLYHTTPLANLESIRQNGLTTGNKPKFEEVSGKNNISFSANEAGARYYGGNDDVMIRTKAGYKPKDLETDLLAGGEGTYITHENIPPEMLEVKINGKWQPLTKFSVSETKFNVPNLLKK